MRISRRGVLKASPIVISALAGCSGDGNGGGDDDQDTGTTTVVTNHDIGETFTVGSGAQQIQYTVNSVDDPDTIGSGENELSGETEFQFVIWEITLENAGEEPFEITQGHFKLDSGDTVHDIHSEAMGIIDNPLSFETLEPGDSVTGKVVFRTTRSPRHISYQNHELKIVPTGILSGEEPHYVATDEAE